MFPQSHRDRSKAASEVAGAAGGDELGPAMATTSLKARSTEQGARTALAEVHRMLVEVCGWFTEGFDTKDLQEAKALLEHLGKMAKRGNGRKDKRIKGHVHQQVLLN